MDKFIVRFSILALTLYMIIVTAFAFYGIDVSEYDYIFTDSFMSGILLTTLCHSQGRYHCVWMRAMCYNLMFVPSVNFIDSKYPIFVNAEDYVYFISASILVTIIATLILAFRHFYKVQKLKTDKSKLHEDRRRNDGED